MEWNKSITAKKRKELNNEEDGKDSKIQDRHLPFFHNNSSLKKKRKGSDNNATNQNKKENCNSINFKEVNEVNAPCFKYSNTKKITNNLMNENQLINSSTSYFDLSIVSIQSTKPSDLCIEDSGTLSYKTENEAPINSTDIFGNKKQFVPIKDYRKESKNKYNNLNLELKEITPIEETENHYFFQLKERLKSTLNPLYFETQQEIQPWMRSVLVDWLMDLSSQLAFKRATFHLAVTLVDIALSKIQNIEASKFQLVGITSLIISAKHEEICTPSIKMFAYSTENAYEPEEIIAFEKNLLEKIDWKVNFPTFATWGNLLTLKWDMWLKLKMKQDHKLSVLPCFRYKLSQFPYMFQKYFNCLDLAIFFPDTLFYDGIFFCSALLYLIIGLFSSIIPEEVVIKIYQGFFDISIICNFYGLNTIFDMFLNEYLSISFSDILPFLNIACQFVVLTGKDFNVAQNHSIDSQVVRSLLFYFLIFEK